MWGREIIAAGFFGSVKACNLASVSAIAAVWLTRTTPNRTSTAHQPLIGASLYLLVLRERFFPTHFGENHAQAKDQSEEYPIRSYHRRFMLEKAAAFGP